MAETPPQIKLSLLPHQQTAVQAMLDAESKRVFSVTSDGVHCKIVASAIILSEPVGSGKTYMILGMIGHRPIPNAFPAVNNSIVMHGNDSIRHRGYGRDESFPIPQITVKFTGKNALIKPNLVVVGSSVLLQWEDAIKTNTSFRVFTIIDVHSLKKFRDMLSRDVLHQFDIILMKNGKVTGNIDLGLGPEHKQKDCTSMIWAMSQLTANRCWSRVFYDDFDTISIPAGSYMLNSLFTVFVSATEKRDAAARKGDKATYANLAEMFRAKTTPLACVLYDKLLFTNMNVKNDKKFTEDSTKVTKLEQYRYVYDNPDDNYIRVMGALGDDEARETVEALNAGAYGHAAQKWGCESRCASDIFKRMLGKKHEAYMQNVYVLEAIDATRKAVINLPEYPEGKKFKAKVLDEIRSAVTKKVSPKVKYFDDRIIAALDELQVEYTRMKERDGIAIQRVIDNVKEGDCQVCHLPLEGFDVFIVRCCGLIVCDTCGIKGNQIALRYNYKVKGNVVCGKCANCRAEIFPQTDLIFVDHNFDMNGLLKAKGDEEPLEAIVPEAKVEEAVDETAEKIPEIKNPKLKCLLKIIRGENIPEREVVNNEIKNLLRGREDIPRPAGTPLKVLVFASFDETLNAIEEFLVTHNINYLRLAGSTRQLNETKEQFAKYGTVMLINTQQNCAGLNLHYATDLVFYHKITNENVEAQVAGRIQRIGRKFNARIHHIWYRNERNIM
jgi:SNF2 family DNA or RNA helicase